MSARGQATTRTGTQRTGARRLVAGGLAAALLLSACTSDKGRSTSSSTTSGSGDTTTATQGSTGTTTGNTNGGTDPNGDTTGHAATGILLSAGHAIAAPAAPVPVVQGTPIDDAGLQAVIARLPDWTAGQAPTTTFNWPTQSRPVPQVGATVPVAFPAPVTEPPAPPVSSGPLHVLRSQPNGDVQIAPFVSITFDEPMVPIATVGQLADADVPATISPAVPGHWQWIGTQTLRFDASSDLVDRLPMATDYTITVPAGTTSATGGVLADDATFQFSTPPVTVQSFTPSGPSLPLTPVFVAAFDQRVDVQAVLATTVVTAGGKPVGVRVATADEIAADPVAGSVVSSLLDGRWIAFRPVVPFAPDTSLDIEIGPGTPSAEGPRTTTSAASYSGSTYAPLKVESSTCAYDNECTPGSSFEIALNNQLDALQFDPASIVVDPAIPGVSIGTSGNVIDIYGATLPHTAYTVTVPATLTDVYGQQLGADHTEQFQVGAATPMLQQFQQPLTTLDPLAAGKAISVVTVNHADFRVRTFQVTPADWAAYFRYFVGTVQGAQPGTELDPPWPTLSDDKPAVDGDADHIVETAVDLSGVLPGHGSVVVLVEPTEHYPLDSPDYWANRPTVTWVQSTTIGVDASNDASGLHAWATDLRDGTPLAGADITLLGDKDPRDETPDDSVATAPVATGADGQATVSLTAQPFDVLVATQGDDIAILPANLYGDSWQKADVLDEARWYVFDDRAVYRPSETVSIKGWVRRLTSSSDSQLQLTDAGATVDFTVTDAQGNQIGAGTSNVGPLGGFDFTFDVPADAALGDANVQIDLQGVSGLSYGSDQHTFQIEEFRRPEFEVDARDESPGPYIQGTPLTLAVDANYYSGGPLGAAPVDWIVSTADASYSPPGWDDFDFGVWTPWWFADDFSGGYGGYGRYPGAYGPAFDGPCCFGGPGTDSTTKQFSGTTDGSGTDYLQVDAGPLDDDHAGLPVTVTAQASVTDVNRQALASTTSVLVHPADLYVGLRGKNTFVRRGDPLVIDAIATGVDGDVAAGAAIHVTASRSESVFTNGQYVDTPVDTQTCDVTSTVDPVSCTFTTDTGGTYTIKATITDDAGRTSRTELTRWVSGADAAPSRTVQQESLTLVPDKQTYAPGDTAQLLVQSPFATGTGRLTI
ncbi:MAG: hypothetical protein JWN62_551, partial [Acidimicrobiales bacterium]|nr:hypothetical protein [Acidimicrobiales bacterium]